ncbi:MAG: tetratricopeptide repeat protein [Isosphaeraceae bacterium]|nr:tetratricopeptide repeat protein [Isosphaeraceae bacterium]
MLRAPTRRTRLATSLALVIILGVSGAIVVLRAQPDPLLLLDAAAREFDRGRVDDAEVLLDRRARRVHPTALDLILRARISQAREHFDESLRVLCCVPDSDPFAGRARLLAGEIELDRDHARAAERLLARAVALDPHQVAARRDLAYIYALQRRRRDCDAQFRALVELGPLDEKRAFIWCQNLCAIWDPREAAARLERFVKNDPGDRQSRLALVEAYLMMSQVSAAEEAIGPLDVEDDNARALRARIALDRGDESAAESLVQAGASDHAGLNVIRARLALIRQDPTGASHFFEAVLKQDPHDRAALYGLGQCLRRLNEPRAITYLEQVAREDRLKRMILESKGPLGQDPRLYFKLGQACEELGQTREALTWYGLAIARDPLDTQAQSARARLKPSGGTGRF